MTAIKKTGGLLLLFCLLLPIATLLPTDAENSNAYVKAIVEAPFNNQTYNTNQLKLKISIEWSLVTLSSVSYRIDNQSRHYFSLKMNSEDLFNRNYTAVEDLPKLSDGEHVLAIYVEAQSGKLAGLRINETILQFAVDTLPPTMKDISVQNQLYSQSDVPLSYTVNETTSWVGYSLDNAANKTLTGNSTIKAVPGSHSIILYANDTAGNMAKTVAVTFKVNNSSLLHNLAVQIAIISVLFVACALGLIVFRHKRNRIALL